LCKRRCQKRGLKQKVRQNTPLLNTDGNNRDSFTSFVGLLRDRNPNPLNPTFVGGSKKHAGAVYHLMHLRKVSHGKKKNAVLYQTTKKVPGKIGQYGKLKGLTKAVWVMNARFACEWQKEEKPQSRRKIKRRQKTNSKSNHKLRHPNGGRNPEVARSSGPLGTEDNTGPSSTFHALRIKTRTNFPGGP